MPPDRSAHGAAVLRLRQSSRAGQAHAARPEYRKTRSQRRTRSDEWAARLSQPLVWHRSRGRESLRPSRAKLDIREDISPPAASAKPAEWAHALPQARGATVCAQSVPSRSYPKPNHALKPPFVRPVVGIVHVGIFGGSDR